MLWCSVLNGYNAKAEQSGDEYESESEDEQDDTQLSSTPSDSRA
jgi:hypothetical protein